VPACSSVFAAASRKRVVHVITRAFLFSCHCTCPATLLPLLLPSLHRKAGLEQYTMSNMARYTVEFVAGGRRGSLLIPLSPTEPCSSLIDSVKSRLSSIKNQPELSSIKDIDVTLQLGDEDDRMLYLADTLSDVLYGAKETVVVVFEIGQPT
jgi:hypothetical protein